jgi:hypothetical protein
MDALIRSAIMAATGRGATTSVGDCARRLVVAILGAVAVGVLVAASVGCAAAALWIFTTPRLGPVGAPLVVACTLLALGIAVLTLTSRSVRRGRIPPPPGATPDVVLADAMRLFKNDKGAALMAALVAGLAAGSDKR